MDHKKQKKAFYRSDSGYGGRNGNGGGSRGGRGGRGGNGSAGGPSRIGADGRRINPMGMYRESPALQSMSMPGILVTTIKNKERAAEKDMIELLERVADELYPETIDPSTSTTFTGEMSIEDELQAELKEMQGGSTGKSKRFRLCQHDIQCVIYIGVLAPLDPRELVYKVMEQVEKSGKSPLKFVSRLIPLTAIGPATIHQLGETGQKVIEDAFTTEEGNPFRFAVVTASRNSDRLERRDWISRTAEIVGSLHQGHTVDLKNADKTIIIEVTRNSMGMSVVDHYDRFKRFNPGAIAEARAQKQVDEENKEVSGSTGTAMGAAVDVLEEGEVAQDEEDAAAIAPAAADSASASTSSKRTLDGEQGGEGSEDRESKLARVE